jgi:hypothetical protein
LESGLTLGLIMILGLPGVLTSYAAASSGLDGNFDEVSIAFKVDASILSSVATASLSVFLTFGFRLIFFFGVITIDFFAGEAFFLAGLGFSSSSSFSSGADPSYFSALLSNL